MGCTRITQLSMLGMTEGVKSWDWKFKSLEVTEMGLRNGGGWPGIQASPSTS